MRGGEVAFERGMDCPDGRATSEVDIMTNMNISMDDSSMHKSLQK